MHIRYRGAVGQAGSAADVRTDLPVARLQDRGLDHRRNRGRLVDLHQRCLHLPVQPYQESMDALVAGRVMHQPQGIFHRQCHSQYPVGCGYLVSADKTGLEVERQPGSASVSVPHVLDWQLVSYEATPSVPRPWH